MTSPVCTLDLARMRRERVEQAPGRNGRRRGRHLVAVRAEQRLVRDRRTGTGFRSRARRRGGARLQSCSATIRGRISITEFPEGSAPELPDDHIHPAVEVEADRRRRASSSRCFRAAGSRIDDAPFPLWQALGEREVLDAAIVLGPAKLTKTLDELECIRQAQAINERAMRTVRAAARPGALATDLSGAFLRTVAELGATVQHRRPGVPGDAALDRQPARTA